MNLKLLLWLDQTPASEVMMRLRHIRRLFSLLVVSALAACGGSDPTGTSGPSSLVKASGDGQVGLIGQSLSSPLVVRVASTTGPLQNVPVAFTVVQGTASLSSTSTTTDQSGEARTEVTFGATPGNVTITATVTNTALTATFNLTASAGTLNIACESGTPVLPAVGDVLPAVSGTGICLGGTATGAEYALIAFNSDPDTNTGSHLSVQFAAHGATAVSTASVTANPALAPNRAASSLAGRAPDDLQNAFDAHLREIARRELAPKVPAALAAKRQRPSFTAIPANPAIGSLVTLNANANQACSNIKNVRARVAAVGNAVIIVADTANPSGGFTDDEYKSFATMFDTLIDPLDRSNFGDPPDIDGNGKVVILFTKEVNLLTPTGSAGVIGGFFFERDLFPLADAGLFAGCPGSNFAEMFYVLVPDPDHRFGDARTKEKVLNLTPGALAHEYQHLINAGRRMYRITPFNDFEETWLNEGLSHVAEELLYFRAAKLGPRLNMTANAITQTQAGTDMFNTYESDNIARFEQFLENPVRTSVYGNNDSLSTRGATWYLLRYLADHRGSADDDTWSQLVNTNLTGQTNLAHVFGPAYMTQIRDWATAVFADDVPGVADPRFLAPSWNLRDIFPRLKKGGQAIGKYPLAVIPISDAAPANVDIWSGGAAYLRFAVPAGGQGSIDWSSSGLPASPLLQFTIVRTK